MAWNSNAHYRTDILNEHHEATPRGRYGTVVPWILASEYLCAVRISEERGEGELLQRRTYVLVAVITPTIIIEGDFNCVLSKNDCMGNKALDKVFLGFGPIDVWGTVPKGTRIHTTHQMLQRDWIDFMSHLSLAARN